MNQTIVPIQPDQLKSIARGTGMDADTAEQLVSALMPLAEQASAVMDESAGVVVTDPSQLTEIKRSRECRLRLKEIRVSVEKCRKAIKEASLRRGQAIDAVAAFLRDKIEPEEDRLEQQEKIAERMEAERLARVKAERERLLAPFGVDTAVLDLGRMGDEMFQSILSKAKADQEARLKAEREAAEAARVKAEQEAAERERLRLENARLEAEAAKARAEAQAARDAADKERREREEAEAKARREKQEAEAKAAREAEAKRAAEAAEAERLARGSDKEKLAALLASLPATVAWPEMRSKNGKAAVDLARHHYSLAIKAINDACVA